MRAWCVVVPRNRVESVRRDLAERGLLEKHLRIASDANGVYLPTTGRVDMGLPVQEREFEPGFRAIRTYRDIVEVPDSLRGSLPTSFDVVGDIAVTKIPKELRPHRRAIGDAMLRWNPRLRVVLEDRGVRGDRRVRDVDVIAGEHRTTTIHVEHGLRYRVDLARAYFSPRLASERLRIAERVADGERVVDPFAGLGPFAILIARRRSPGVVHASDANPEAAALLRANAAANRADRVTVREGDARAVLREVAPVDRVILDLPHSALDFLPDALASLGPRGTIHLYRIVEVAELAETMDAIRAEVRKGGLRLSALARREVRAYSPTRQHVAFDITVARG